MIKFAVRRNLIYPLQLLLWNFLRDTESSLINHFFEADSFLIFTHLMFLGEFLAGITIYSYQMKFLRESIKPKYSNYFGIKLNSNKYFSITSLKEVKKWFTKTKNNT